MMAIGITTFCATSSATASEIFAGIQKGIVGGNPGNLPEQNDSQPPAGLERPERRKDAAKTTEAVRQLLGKNVANQDGRQMGRVDAVATAGDGRIVYILISQTRSRERLNPIPFSSIRFDAGTGVVILDNVDEKKLAQAPAINLDELDRLEDPDFRTHVNGYYGQDQDPSDEAGSGTVEKDPEGHPDRSEKPEQRI